MIYDGDHPIYIIYICSIYIYIYIVPMFPYIIPSFSEVILQFPFALSAAVSQPS